MLQMILPEGSSSLLAFFGILFAFGATVLATAKLSPYLPKDAGREFAHDGKLSAGKPRGAGIIFVMAFVASVLLFSPLSAELVIYLLLIVVCMMTGFLDDASKTPWGEYKKGFLDLCVAALVAITFLKYNSNVVELALFHVKFTLPPVVFAILTVILVWTSVKKVNANYTKINAESQMNDPESVRSFYKKLIALRKDPEYKETVVYGELEPVWEDVHNLMAYYRKGDKNLLVVGNYQKEPQTIELAGECRKVLINNYDNVAMDGNKIELQGYQFLVIEM